MLQQERKAGLCSGWSSVGYLMAEATPSSLLRRASPLAAGYVYSGKLQGGRHCRSILETMARQCREPVNDMKDTGHIAAAFSASPQDGPGSDDPTKDRCVVLCLDFNCCDVRQAEPKVVQDSAVQFPSLLGVASMGSVRADRNHSRSFCGEARVHGLAAATESKRLASSFGPGAALPNSLSKTAWANPCLVAPCRLRSVWLCEFARFHRPIIGQSGWRIRPRKCLWQ